jgi:hypothetical protein
VVSSKGVRGFGNTVTLITHIGTIRWKVGTIHTATGIANHQRKVGNSSGDCVGQNGAHTGNHTGPLPSWIGQPRMANGTNNPNGATPHTERRNHPRAEGGDHPTNPRGRNTSKPRGSLSAKRHGRRDRLRLRGRQPARHSPTDPAHRIRNPSHEFQTDTQIRLIGDEKHNVAKMVAQTVGSHLHAHGTAHGVKGIIAISQCKVTKSRCVKLACMG